MPRRLHFVWIGVLAALQTASYANTITVTINRHRPGPATAVTGTISARSVANPGQPLAFALPLSAIPLPPGEWFVAAHIDGDWSEPRLLSIGEGEQSAVLDTFPMAQLTARVTVPNGKEPHELQAYFQRVSMEDLSSPSEGSVACSVTKGTARCQLPAGEFDLAFRIPGYVSRYRWKVPLTAGPPAAIGLLQFVAGSTLSGRVESAQRRDIRLDRVTVVVRPAAGPGANDEQRHRSESARITTHPTRRGFFAVDLPPGLFTVEASYDDLVSEEMTAEVSGGHEALLRQPLRLEPQRSVTVRVHPPADPWSKPWTIELARVDPIGVLLSERSLKTSFDGTGRFGNVLPGHYRLTVVRTKDQTWASQLVDLDQDTTLDVPVKAIRVTGTIRMGSKPLQATAQVRSDSSGASAFIRSKADGTFLAALPAPEHDTWDHIEVRADSQHLKRVLEHVHVQRREDGTAELNLDLPARTITGIVVDDTGALAAPAMIDVLLPDGSLQQVESTDGSFLISGLESGHHRLRAASNDRESIDLQDVALGDAEDATADVVLPIVPVGHLRGVIRALDGPVLGAVLFATRPDDQTRPIILSRADPEGRFDIRFPGGTPEVFVAINAPGFAFRLARAPLGMDEETFAVDQNGGALSVDAPPAHAGLRPYLMHNGAALSAIVAAFVSGVPFQANLSERVKFQIPSIEPGAYSLCWVPEGAAATRDVPPCVTGVLAPHGTLTLSE